MRRKTAALFLSAALIVLGGFAAPAPAQADPALISAPAKPAALPWPARIPPRTEPDAKGVIRILPETSGLVGVHAGVRAPTDQDLADAKSLLGEDFGPGIRFEGPGSFIYRPFDPARQTSLQPKAKAPPPKDLEPSQRFVFISGSAGPVAIEIQRTWFALYDPEADSRGLVLLMPGMLGTPEPVLERFTARLRKEGWTVVRMLSQSSRFTQHIVFDIDLADPEPAIRTIAAEMTGRVAECAYAAQVACARVLAARPALAQLPRIAVGMSGGAMILPPVLAREPDRYAAAILIAGGADFFQISDLSNYKYLINAVDFRWLPQPPTDEERGKVDRLYLDAALLDPYHTATLIKDKPLLLIHADHDGAVPAQFGDLLWERLGKPERWVRTAGHEEVFIKLPAEFDAIMTWLDAHMPVK